MDFFAAQDNARKNTKWLVLMFSMAVLSMIAIIYFAVIAFIVSQENNTAPEALQLWRPDLLLIIASSVIVLILQGSIYRIVKLSAGGGKAVAESLGGREVSRSTSDPLERRLLNVVDEMAIASGVAVPKVYLLEHEASINAFAAGYDVQSAVIAVTRGCLEELKREELQGVIAHEFSHIFNGDMRINIRLMGILHGILMLTILGRMMLHSRSRYHHNEKSSENLAPLGLVFWLVGYIGLFFGRMIKAAVSRQREFLADASAVQFTRNPAGLAGALKRIGGFTERTIAHPNAEEASHMFFDIGVPLPLALFATHPPLEERIRRLDPAFIGDTRETPIAESLNQAFSGFTGEERLQVTARSVRESVGNQDQRHLGYAHRLLAMLPNNVLNDTQDPRRSRALIYALLAISLARPSQLLPSLLKNEDEELIALACGYGFNQQTISKAARLPLIELTIPAIRELGGEEATSLLQNCRAIVEADARVSIFEFAVVSLLEQALGGQPEKRRSGSPRQIATDCATILSVLVHAGQDAAGPATKAFTEAWRVIGLGKEGELLEKEAISFVHLRDALGRLNGLKYRFKARIIEACTLAISADSRVTISEAELLRAIGARLDCPIPPLLPGSV